MGKVFYYLKRKDSIWMIKYNKHVNESIFYKAISKLLSATFLSILVGGAVFGASWL